MITTAAPSAIIRQLLVQLGVGLELPVTPTPGKVPPDWQVYAASEPAAPDDVITVFDTAGRDQGRSGVDMVRSEMFGVQVRVRSSTFTPGWQKAKAVCDALDGTFQAAVMVDGVPYAVRQVQRTGGVLPLGFDMASRRRIFVVNALVALG